MTTATLEKVKEARDELALSGRSGLNAVHRIVGGNKATVKKRLAELLEAGDLPPESDRRPFLPVEVQKKLSAIGKACDEISKVFQETMFDRLREERVLVRAEIDAHLCRHCGEPWNLEERDQLSETDT